MIYKRVGVYGFSLKIHSKQIKMMLKIVLVSCLVAIAASQQSCQSTSTPCNRQCQPPEGQCLSNGKCLCLAGYTGPLPEVHSADQSLVEASHCLNTCGHLNTHQSCTSTCDARCAFPLGTCQTSGTYEGKCLCHYGFTGPNALWIDSGANNRKVYADYCTDTCRNWSRYDRWCADRGIPYSFYQ